MEEGKRDSAAIDMALDDVIMADRSRRPQHRRDHRSSRPTRSATVHKPTTTTSSSSSSYSSSRPVRQISGSRGGSLRVSVDASRVRSDDYRRDEYSRRDGGERVESSLTVANLHHEVSPEDLQELFGSVGRVAGVKMEYDRAGRSNGTAIVSFFGRTDAVAAADRFHNIPLDGLPMRVAVMGRPYRMHQGGEPSEQVDRWQHDRFNSSSSGGGRRGGGVRLPHSERNGGRSSERQREQVSASMLDNDLDAYMMKRD